MSAEFKESVIKMRLCYGTFATVLRLCALNGKNQLDVHDALLMSLDPEDKLGLSRDSTQATRWFNCKTNLNGELIKSIDYIKPEVFAGNFNDIVMDVIDPGKAALAALAIRAIIKKDDAIIPEAVVDLVNNTRKIDLISGSTAASPGFFAGVLLYAVSKVRNKEGQPCISGIDDAFLAAVSAEKDISPRSSAPTSDSPNTEAMRRPEYAILPVYLVLDTSYSMQKGNKFNAAFSFLPELLSAMMESSSLSEKIRVEVITFDEKARVELPLGGLNEIEDWIIRYKKNPIIPDGDNTYYGEVFKKLRCEISEGVRQIQSNTANGISYKAYRPVVFFITDGAPNDDFPERGKAFAQLTDRNFEFRPNIICVGVGDAKYDDLVAYGAGRYNSPTGSYMTGNEKLVIVPRDGVLPSKALRAIVPALVASIIASFDNVAYSGDFGGIPDLFGSQNELFDDIDYGDEYP